ncbi:MAG: hypothetical protein IPM83_17030 [Ignavibacteria bacterium]|nr:hypothetical protein [Ignavibacteria bacterium]
MILFALGSTVSKGQWNVTAQMLEGRYFFETQVLDSHRVLIMGWSINEWDSNILR